ncbi:SagB/ThcOx family dehydrogenase [Clostridium cellulovorans]|uniref:SagB-type dehydrogenase domain n=1 Tax=Clostridium cellulovorans (strain ATCC 35296 / DSM 3052 / OCM 3 / 743B) TaxID=573061 RepID=D9SMH4_CLOC7|nr:SagB/ThcOx family dehydrogenase [Clostridium cellulovorans]ADL53830.1 SagB-type dehydrogenase domain [Clostridium cellulovorans 743B]
MDKLQLFRELMKANFLKWDHLASDQDRKIPQPPIESDLPKYYQEGEIIELPGITNEIIVKKNIFLVLNDRMSRRKYNKQALTLEELSFLLWATQAVKRIRGKYASTVRNVPSAGARHPFETYLAIHRVHGLKRGVYRYLALSHQLIFLFDHENLELEMTKIALDQEFVGDSAVTFIWSCVPYRGEWKYYISAHKSMLIDVGHLCQNLYLACEAIGCGTCAVAAYDQYMVDEFLNLDGDENFVIYLASVGRIDE